METAKELGDRLFAALPVLIDKNQLLSALGWMVTNVILNFEPEDRDAVTEKFIEVLRTAVAGETRRVAN